MKTIVEQQVDTSYMYTKLHEAKKEIIRRWNDPILTKKVREYWEGDFNVLSGGGPFACLGRNIISPNNELKYFLGLCDEVNLSPLFIEHRTDKFVASNPDKYHLARMYFYNGRGKKNGERFSAKNIIDIGISEGKKLDKIRTVSGEDFVGFHHRILDATFPNIKGNFIDITAINKLKNRKLSQSYDMYLALFVYFGILFENYLPHKSESNFLEVVHTAYGKVEKEFGVRPLIVPLSPMEDQDDLYWWSYPESLKEMFQNKN